MNHPPEDDANDAQLADPSAARLIELDERLRGGALPAADAQGTESRELLLMQLERRWPRASPAPDSAATEPPVSIGPYRVERELGRGGFGVVLLAHDSRHDRMVALKVPRPEVLGDSAVRERFVREAQAVAELEHPHVVKVYEIGRVGPIDYIASEYCPDGSLADLLAAKSHEFSPWQAAELVQRLAEAVEHIHAQGMLHRDLKPSNVLLAPSTDPAAEDGLPFRPLVTDFGLAKLVDQSYYETASSVMLGTPLYMSPEQAACQQHRIGPWTDVYSLGVILYELVGGEAPFTGPGLVAVLTQLQTAPPAPLTSLRPDVPRDLETICLKCLAKEPSERYATAGELAADLDRYRAGQSITARRPTVMQRLQRWSYQPPRIFEAGMVGLVLNAILTLWLLLEIPFVLWGPSNVDRHAVFMGAVMMLSVFTIPLLAISYFTIHRRRWGPWAGMILSAANLLVSLAGMFNLIAPFGDLYDATPALRGIMFGLTSTLIFFQMLYFVVACRATAQQRPSSE